MGPIEREWQKLVRTVFHSVDAKQLSMMRKSFFLGAGAAGILLSDALVAQTDVLDNINDDVAALCQQYDDRPPS